MEVLGNRVGLLGVAQRIGPMLLLASGASICLLVVGIASAEGPPPIGDWYIGAGESVLCDHQVLDLRGDLVIDGELRLSNCTLVVWSTAGDPGAITVREGGALWCAQTLFTPSPEGNPYGLRAERGSTISMFEGALVGAGWSVEGTGLGAGAFIATDTTVRRTFFDGCVAGIWASGANVTAVECTFSRCEPGTLVADGGHLSLVDCEYVGCGTGAVADAGALTATGTVFDGCSLSAFGLATETVMRECTFVRFGTSAVMAYSSDIALDGCGFQDGEGVGVECYSSSVAITGCRFLRCGVDVSCTESTASVSGTDHTGTADEALHMEWSTFDVDGVRCNGSYWGLRTYMSIGSCRNLTCRDGLMPVLVEQSIGVTLENVTINYTLADAVKMGPRGIVVTGSSILVSDVTVRGVRTALALDSSEGFIERVEAEDLTHEGVVVSMCSGLTLREIHVSNAMDGFRTVLLCDEVTLEGCSADRCRATGFNFTYSGSPDLLRCNASNSPVGMRSEGSFPRIEDCDLYGPVDVGTAFPDTVGLDSLLGGPHVTGGTVTGWAWGMRFNGTRGYVANVTFVGCARECLLLTCSTLGTVEGCTLLGASNATGVVLFGSSTTLRDNYASGMRSGVLAMSNTSRPTIEGNVIEDMTGDGLVVFNHVEAVLRDNTVQRCNGSALWVALYSAVDCQGDEFSSCGAALVRANTGSVVVVRGAAFSNATVGVSTEDSPLVKALSCRFIGLGRGIVATRSRNLVPGVTGMDVLVDGCYFQNNSAYGVGAVNGALSVRQCTFIANGGGVTAWNSTVTLLDTTMVSNIMHGLMTDNCTASWAVEGLCRVIQSPILSRVLMVVDGGELWLEETRVSLGAGGGLTARGGASVHMRDVHWDAGGAPMTLTCCTVSLSGVLMEGVGPSPDGTGGARGIGLWGCSLVATDSTVSGSDVGLALTDCTARLERCSFLDCRGGGVIADGTTLSMSWCEMAGITPGYAISLRSTEAEIDNMTSMHVNGTLTLGGGSARLTDCSLAGAIDTAVYAERGEVTLVNSTVGSAVTRAGPEGRIWTWWRLSAVVGWANTSELSSIGVWVDDADGHRVADATADARGRAGPVLVLSSLRTEEGLDPMGPHIVHAMTHGYAAQRSVELTSSMEVVLQLVDTDPPVITVLSPDRVETWMRSGTVELVVRAPDAGSGTERIEAVLDDGVVTWTAHGGTFVRTVQLTNGNHIIIIKAWDLAGNSALALLSVRVETRPIILVVNRPTDGIATNATRVVVEGFVSRADVTLRVNDALVSLNGTSFSHSVAMDEGSNRLVIVAEDMYGHRTMVNLTVAADHVPPELLLQTERTIYTTEQRVLLQGLLGEAASLTINGRLAMVPPGWFNISYPVILGETEVLLTATDAFGNTRTERVVVIRSEPEVEEEGTDWWQAVPFVVIIPLLATAEWYVFVSRARLVRDRGVP